MGRYLLMRIAFGIVSLFPGGGLQRDCVRLARMAKARGHEVRVLTARLRGDAPPDLSLEILPNRAWTNHGRNLRFATDLVRSVSDRFDRIVGFDKLLGLDVLYCADPSITARRSHTLRSITPRYRTLHALEGASFAPGRTTQVLLLGGSQLEAYRRAWDTEPERMTLLAPAIDLTRRHPEYRVDGTRDWARRMLGISDDQKLWLAIGLQPQTKGFDRIVDALPSDPASQLVIVGLWGDEKSARQLERTARRLDCQGRLLFLGLREDIPILMAAADVLVHPARYETTGTVLLEALVNGLPVITTAACGYAEHVAAADGGVVIAEPFSADQLLAALRDARDPGQRAQWGANAIDYGKNHDLYTGADRALGAILSEA
jgi:UDP-glucose:(heptosyl)LPS alpha-1,3-glucosyltransferase